MDLTTLQIDFIFNSSLESMSNYRHTHFMNKYYELAEHHAAAIKKLKYKVKLVIDDGFPVIYIYNVKARDETLILLVIADKHIDWETTWI